MKAHNVVAIESCSVAIDDDVSGFEWTIGDVDALAKLIAVISLGQAEHAAQIIAALEPHGPAYTEAALIHDAKAQLRITGRTKEEQTASTHHRDGFLFECISWIAARQSGDRRTFLKDPHLDPTSHGLDGLILQLAPDKAEIARATICEDKCTKNPREKFRDDVLITFGEHHRGQKRARDLVANAVSLIKDSGAHGTAAVKAAARVTDKEVRCYRAALTTEPLTTNDRAKLFKGYSDLDGINQDQRIGVTFPLAQPLRDWFQSLADAVIAALDGFAKAEAEVTDDV